MIGRGVGVMLDLHNVLDKIEKICSLLRWKEKGGGRELICRSKRWLSVDGIFLGHFVKTR